MHVEIRVARNFPTITAGRRSNYLLRYCERYFSVRCTNLGSACSVNKQPLIQCERSPISILDPVTFEEMFTEHKGESCSSPRSRIRRPSYSRELPYSAFRTLRVAIVGESEGAQRRIPRTSSEKVNGASRGNGQISCVKEDAPKRAGSEDQRVHRAYK